MIKGEFASIFVNEDLNNVKDDNTDMDNRNGNHNNRKDASRNRHNFSRTQGMHFSTNDYAKNLPRREAESFRKDHIYRYHGGKENVKKKIARMRLKQDAQRFKEQGNIYEATALELEAIEIL